MRMLIAGLTLVMMSGSMAEARKAQQTATNFTPEQQQRFVACMKAKSTPGGNSSVATPVQKQNASICRAQVRSGG